MLKMNLQETLSNIIFDLSNELLLLNINTLSYVNSKLNYQISAGGHHSLILTGTGELYATGENYSGQLGLGDNTNRNTFTHVDVPVKAQRSIVAISVGNYHSMILTDSGELYVTGRNDYGQLGLGDNKDRNTFTLVDVPAKARGSIVAISTGDNYSMILTSTGELYATGWNDDGQLGLGDNDHRNTFILVDVPANARGSIVAISTNGDYSMILTNSSELYATGWNGGGQLGLGDNEDRNIFTLVDVPVKIQGSIVAISAGNAHSMILTDSGELYVTGANYDGQLGLGDDGHRNTFTRVDVPVKIQGPIIAISAGYAHSMILIDSGELYVTGANYDGQLGLGDNDYRNTFTLVDVPTKARESIVAISAGSNYSMILTDSGEMTTGSKVLLSSFVPIGVRSLIYATGWNSDGRLGLGDNTSRNTFTLVDVPAIDKFCQTN